MPRKKLIRHFESRYGVSQEMVDVEATYIAREHQDYMLLATNDLKERLVKLRTKWQQADGQAEMLIQSLPERDALAFQCLLVRDLYLVLELYGSCLKTARTTRHDQAKDIRPFMSPRLQKPNRKYWMVCGVKPRSSKYG